MNEKTFRTMQCQSRTKLRTQAELPKEITSITLREKKDADSPEGTEQAKCTNQ